MSIPGLNLLSTVQTVIVPTTIRFFRFTGRITNDIGMEVNQFAAGTDIRANVLPVPRKHYQEMGLDYNKRYIMIWSTTDFNDLSRDRAPDEIEYNGKRYTLQNEEDWTPIDNWNAVLAVEVRDV